MQLKEWEKERKASSIYQQLFCWMEKMNKERDLNEAVVTNNNDDNNNNNNLLGDFVSTLSVHICNEQHVMSPLTINTNLQQTGQPLVSSLSSSLSLHPSPSPPPLLPPHEF